MLKSPMRAPDLLRIAALEYLRAAVWLAIPLTCSAEALPPIAGTPLAAHSEPNGKTMFTRLTPEETGVRTENRYADPKMWGELYHEFDIGPIGTGVAIGDYDGDGRPDIFVVSKTESCRLFRNLGNWKFEDVTDRAGVGDKGAAASTWKQGATFADVNNDGRLDLYVCRFAAANLLYINQGDGTFKEMASAYGLDVSDASATASFYDYDRDGWLDVYVQTNLLNNSESPTGQRDYLFRNNRDGSFTNVTDAAGISGKSQGNSITWWDYDLDGWPDIYVANDFAEADKLYRNNHDGTFTNVIDQVVPNMTYSSMGSDLGDVNNDGLMDLIVADMAATTRQKDQRTMADTRARSKDPREGSTAAPHYLRNTVYLNTGTGYCLEAAFLTGLDATDWTWTTRFEDLDNDGRVDLFVTNGMHREIHNADLIYRMMSAESAFERVRIARNSPVLVETNLAFRNLGDLRFESVGPAWGLDHKGVSFGAALGDLDGDGDLDLVYANYLDTATVLRNDSQTGRRVIFELRGTASNRFGIGAVVRIESASGAQVRQLGLTRGYMSSSEPVAHFGVGEDTSLTRVEVTWPSGRQQVFENLATDHRYTLTEPEDLPAPVVEQPVAPRQFAEVTATVNLSLSVREETIDEIGQQRLLPTRFNRFGPSIAVGDLDGDKRDDVVIGGTSVEVARILLGSESGGFVAVDNAVFGKNQPVNDGPVLVFDANGDGKNDLLVTKGGNSLSLGSPEYQPALFFNNGASGLHPAPANSLPSVFQSIGAAAVADFNRDGRLDLFLGARMSPGQYPLSPHSALLANRGGTFEDVTDTLASGLREVGMVTSALWSDVDADGWADLLVTVEWGHVKYFRNIQGTHFEDWTEKAGFAAAGTGWWTSLAAADFNGDGRLDYVAGNAGLNTQYRADAIHPALLLLGDFKDDGTTQLVEACYEGEKIYPWRSRRDLGLAVPAVLKRFPRNDIYARASLDEIFGADKVMNAQRFAATELRSGVFLSQPDGNFRFEPLPRLAQIAPLQGIAAGDFDGDGKADVYALQNSYAPSPVVGRFIGGLSQLLHGQGNGDFTPVSPARSNLIVPGDAKALVVLNLDGDARPDFFLSRNGGTTLAYQNSDVPGGNSLELRLNGPVGNPTAIGARVELELGDGTKQVAEVYAGSGFWSQSSAAVYFGFPDGNPPRSVRVRWPSGSATTHEVPSGSTRLTLSAPTP